MARDDPAPDEAAARARDVVTAWMHAYDGPVEHEGSRWTVMLAGEHKRTVGVTLSVGDHTMTAQSFFVRAPDEDPAALYGLLLRRHLRSYTLRFALLPDGDIVLVGVLPLDAVTPTELDRMLGQLLMIADETFDEALRLGFASYISREQAWRAQAGLPRNPIS